MAYANRAENSLDALERRITELEERVFGKEDKDVEYPKDSDQLIQTLINLNSQFKNAVAGKHKIDVTLRRLNDLDRLLDPVYSDTLTLSDSSKADIVLAESEKLESMAAQLEQVKEHSQVLSSEHLQQAPALFPQVQALGTVHLEQQDKTAELDERTQSLLRHYNGLVKLISQQLASWDETLTRLEIMKQPKQTQD